MGRTSHPSLVFFSFSCIFSSFNIIFFVSDQKKKKKKVVFRYQHAFIEGRQILHVILFANEPFDSSLKSNNSGLILKIDIGKEYDYIN